MNIVITERKPLKIIGMKIVTSMRENKIPELWNSFFDRIHEIENTVNPAVSIGVCFDVQEDEHFSYIAGRVISDGHSVPKGMVLKKLPKQLVAVFTHKGPVEKLSETYNYIFEEWLPNSQYEHVKAPDLEWYDDRFKFGEEDSEMDIHIPVRIKENSAASIFSFIGKDKED